MTDLKTGDREGEGEERRGGGKELCLRLCMELHTELDFTVSLIPDRVPTVCFHKEMESNDRNLVPSRINRT